MFNTIDSDRAVLGYQHATAASAERGTASKKGVFHALHRNFPQRRPKIAEISNKSTHHPPERTLLLIYVIRGPVYERGPTERREV